MQEQLDLFEAAQRRDTGIARALSHAEEETPDWGDIAFEFLCHYANISDKFMIEDVRSASEGTVPEPPSARAWGSVVVKAAKKGVIHHVGYAQTKNPNAHKTPASVWQGVINQ